MGFARESRIIVNEYGVRPKFRMYNGGKAGKFFHQFVYNWNNLDPVRYVTIVPDENALGGRDYGNWSSLKDAMGYAQNKVVTEWLIVAYDATGTMVWTLKWKRE